jgi:hypothetical protein
VVRSYPPPSLDADGVLSRHTDPCFSKGPRDAVWGPAFPFPGPSAPRKLCPPPSAPRGGRRVLPDQYSRTALTNAASEVRTSKRHAHCRFTDGLWSPKTHAGKTRENVRPFALPTRRPPAFPAEGLRSSAGIGRSWFATRRSPRYGRSAGTRQGSRLRIRRYEWGFGTQQAFHPNWIL